MESGWSGWRQSRCSLTRKRVSCEYDNDGGECGGGSRSGNEASASLLCTCRSGGGCAYGVRCGADGSVCAGYTAGAMDGSGVVLKVCAQERNEGGGVDDWRSCGG